jgi:hypothetical protein
MPDTPLERIKAKRQAANFQAASQSRQDAVLNALKENQIATLLSNQKPTVILTDQTDLGDKIKDLAGTLEKAVKSIDGKEDSAKLLKALEDLSVDLYGLGKKIEQYQTAIDRQTVQLVSALNKLELSPNITVTPAAVTVAPADFKPLQKALQGLKPTISKRMPTLADFRATDIDTDRSGTQYIGFMALDGSWYLMQSDERNNTTRYYFGTGDYASAWEQRHNYDYTTLSEAYRAVSA